MIEKSTGSVKGEIVKNNIRDTPEAANNKSTDSMAKTTDTVLLKREIVRSLAIASLILCLEIMLYFAWR